MKTKLTVVLMLVVLAGCDGHGENAVLPEKNAVHPGIPYWHRLYCIDGVTYLVAKYGMTPMLGRDSKIIPCD